MVYASGRIVITSAPATRPGPTLGAFDPVTGAALWRLDLPYSMGSMVTDGRQVFVGIRADDRVERLFEAFDAATGAPVPGWGASLPGARANSLVTVTGVAGSRLLGNAGPPLHFVSLSVADGASVPVPIRPGGRP